MRRTPRWGLAMVANMHARPPNWTFARSGYPLIIGQVYPPINARPARASLLLNLISSLPIVYVLRISISPWLTGMFIGGFLYKWKWMRTPEVSKTLSNYIHNIETCFESSVLLYFFFYFDQFIMKNDRYIRIGMWIARVAKWIAI